MLKRLVNFSFGLLLLTCCGCYERTLAPELTYDQQQVDGLNEEIKNFPWDE